MKEKTLYDSLLLRAGELFLKGKNQPFFERKLVENLKRIIPFQRVQHLRGRILTEYHPQHQQLRRVFGLVSYSPAFRVRKEIDSIKEGLLLLAAGKTGTFKIEPKRSDKSFTLTSPEMNILFGKYIEEKTTLRFDGKNPEHLFGIEINTNGAFLFSEIVPCFGGLPTGVEGRVALLVEDKNSILSGLLLMKRGCHIFPVAFAEQNIPLLQKFSPVPLSLKLVQDLEELQLYLQQRQLSALVSGQTFRQYKRLPVEEIVLRPLITFSETEIEEQLQMYENV